MTFNKTRAWIAGAVVVWLLMSVAAWFLLISPKRAEAADLREQTAQVDAQNLQTEARIETLKKQAAEMPKLQAERDVLRTALPKDDELAALTRRINGMSTATGMTLDSITPGSPATVAAPAAAAATTTTTTESATSEESATTDSTASTSAPAAATSALVKVPVTITVTGGYTSSLDFLKRLQTTDGRNYLVESISIADPQLVGANADTDAAKAKGWVTMTIVGSVYALPESATSATAASSTTSATTTGGSTGTTSTGSGTPAN